MAYIVFGICAALCVGVSILAIKVVRESRELMPPKKKRKKYEFDDDDY